MLSITPVKLMIVLLFGLIILGPDKLPQVARQVGQAWSDFKKFRQRLENEVRSAVPQLPSTTELTSVIRSPVALLDRLAYDHEQKASSEAAMVAAAERERARNAAALSAEQSSPAGAGNTGDAASSAGELSAGAGGGVGEGAVGGAGPDGVPPIGTGGEPIAGDSRVQENVVGGESVHPRTGRAGIGQDSGMEAGSRASGANVNGGTAGGLAEETESILSSAHNFN